MSAGYKLSDLVTNLETNHEGLADVVGEIVINGVLDDLIDPGSIEISPTRQKIDEAIEEKTDAAKDRIREVTAETLKEARALLALFKEVTE